MVMNHKRLSLDFQLGDQRASVPGMVVCIVFSVLFPLRQRTLGHIVSFYQGLF